MLENMTLIASLISGATAITTSLRAVGKSREITRAQAETRIKDGCRTGGSSSGKPSGQGSLLIHTISTIIWLVLSIGFAVPLYHERWGNGIDIWLWIWISPYVLLLIAVFYIWSKALCFNR